MPSRIDEAGHAFDYPVEEHWGESRNVCMFMCVVGSV